MEDRDSCIKDQLVTHLLGGEAFLPLDTLLQEIIFEKVQERPYGLPYSIHDLFHHICFTQKDILEYCKEKDYKAPEWPAAYWPEKENSLEREQWEDLQKDYFRHRKELAELILDPETDLFQAVPSNAKHTIFREAMLVIEHTAYHTGQLVILLRHLGMHS